MALSAVVAILLSAESSCGGEDSWKDVLRLERNHKTLLIASVVLLTCDFSRHLVCTWCCVRNENSWKVKRQTCLLLVDDGIQRGGNSSIIDTNNQGQDTPSSASRALSLLCAGVHRQFFLCQETTLGLLLYLFEK